MEESVATAAGAPAATFQVASIEVSATPRRESGAVITAMQYALLREGPPASRLTSRRDVCIGICASCLTGVIGLFFSTQYFTAAAAPTTPPAPVWSAWVSTVILLAAAAASGVVAALSHFDSDKSVTAYQECCRTIETQFTGPAE